MKKQYYNLVLLLALGFLLSFSACRNGDGDNLVHKDQNEFSPEERTQIGQSLDGFISNENTVFNILNPAANQEIYQYMQTLYASLVNTDVVIHRNDFSWTVKILVDDANKNAFITPGGSLYLTTGLLLFIESEHELMSVMAHEIKYADSDILLEILKKEYSGVVLGDIVLGSNPVEARDMALWLKDVRYDEEEVLAADVFANDIICEFLYDPHGMRDILNRINEMEEQPTWAENRPSSEDRLTLIDQNTSECGPGNKFVDRYQEHLGMLP